MTYEDFQAQVLMTPRMVGEDEEEEGKQKHDVDNPGNQGGKVVESDKRKRRASSRKLPHQADNPDLPHNDDLPAPGINGGSGEDSQLQEEQSVGGGGGRRRKLPPLILAVSTSYPDEVDWRTTGFFPPVRNQGRCGERVIFSNNLRLR